jgi:tungstate transport system ATP-binding protein
MNAMRAPATDLPLMLEDVSLLAREVTILDHVSLTFAAGAPTMLVGPNGSGKSSLMRIAMGLNAPSSGRVTYGGRSDVPPVRRAIVFQRPVMLRRSAAGNLTYALAAAGVPRAERDAAAQDLLDRVGLGALSDRPARRMSGGEQQRLAIARALAKEPEILFLDEPTASLDPAATKATEDIISGIAARGIKIVMATHDLGEARRLGGEIVLMNRGRIVEVADANTFFTSPVTDAARRFVAGELLV